MLGVVVLSVAVGCGGSASGPSALRREVGSGGPTSLPAARVHYGMAMAMEEGPPISLTASDGTGLELTRLDARAVVDGPLAFTELHLTFENPQDRVLEGRFAITLPDSAAISRFAMKIDGKWMEAEVVERMAARRAYEDFLHRKQDPALLEKEAGNEFRARVFPIPAKGVKELIVSYSQELPDPDDPYVLPLVGLPKIDEVAATVQIARAERGAIVWDEVTLEEKGWQPDRNLAAPGSAASHALGAGKVVAMRVQPELSATPERFAQATVLVDTSASRALGFPAYARQVDELVAELGKSQPGLMVTVVAFDQGTEELYRGKASDAAGQIESALRGRMPLGASDLERALRWAKDTKSAGRLILVSDAVATAGEVDTAKLGAAVADLQWIERVDVVLAGGIRDRAAAEVLTRKRSRDGAILTLDDGAEEVARRIALATESDLAVAVAGARAVWPTELDGLQPGDAAMVYAWFGDKPPRTVSLTIGGDERSLAVEPSLAPLVERAAVQAEIARLQASVGDAPDAKARAARIEQIVKLSTAHRVLSDHTALLVLETEDDYARFGIDRKALAGILVVGARGVEIAARKDIAVIATDELEDVDGQPDRDGDDGKKKGKEEDRKKEEKEADKGTVSTGKDDDQLLVLLADESKPEPEKSTEQPAMRAPAPPPEPPRFDPSPGADDAEESEDEESVHTADVSVSGRVSRPDAVVVEGLVRQVEPEPEDPEPSGPPAYTGKMATVMDLIARGRRDDALDEALTWRGDDPSDVMALIALGEAFEADAKLALAARAYGSIIDLFPARADLRRFAGERLDRLASDDEASSLLAIDTYRRAVEQRPDHLTGHRLLAMALVRAGQHAEAFAALEHGLAQDYPDSRFAEGDRILREDLGLVAAAWLAVDGKRRADIDRRLRAAGATLETEASLRFVLTWETDANDVDFHIRDAKKGHAFYSKPELRSGGSLYADVTTGYGPECFTIRGTPKAAPYRLSIHYYSRGPMGYGMGKLEIVRHDGKGKLSFEERPYVVMNDQAYVDLGKVE